MFAGNVPAVTCPKVLQDMEGSLGPLWEPRFRARSRDVTSGLQESQAVRDGEVQWGWFGGQASLGEDVTMPQYPSKRSSDGSQGQQPRMLGEPMVKSWV